MCGIFACPNITDNVRKMLPHFGIAMQARGDDAWGAIGRNPEGEFDIVKHHGPLTDSWYVDLDTVNGWTEGIFHTRGCSPGSANTQENAHPFLFKKPNDSGWVCGVHNGAIVNHHELATVNNRNFPVDSMHLWKMRAEGESWEKCRGWANLVWYETGQDGTVSMNLARFNHDNIHVAELEGGEFIVCSTKEPVRIFAKMYGNPLARWWTVDEGYRYYFERDKDGKLTFYRDPKLIKFGGTDGVKAVANAKDMVRSTGTISSARPGGTVIPFAQGGHSSLGAVYNDYCLKCNHGRINNKEEILCRTCLAYFNRGWEKVLEEEMIKEKLAQASSQT